MTDTTKRPRDANGRYLPRGVTAGAAGAVPATVEPSRQSLEQGRPAGLVEFTRDDPLTGRPYTGRGVVVGDPGTGVLLVAPLADHTVQVTADAVTPVPAGE